MMLFPSPLGHQHLTPSTSTSSDGGLTAAARVCGGGRGSLVVVVMLMASVSVARGSGAGAEEGGFLLVLFLQLARWPRDVINLSSLLSLSPLSHTLQFSLSLSGQQLSMIKQSAGRLFAAREREKGKVLPQASEVLRACVCEGKDKPNF